ncbi:2-pyrone-4,6-dicarboxylate hydrolase, partial [Elioraea sp. Yellowstone]
MMFDAHLHIFDPAHPLTANQGFVPAPFTVAEYRARVAPLGVVGGAVVAASPQGADPAPLLAAEAWARAAFA